MDINIQPGTSDMKAVPNTGAANSAAWMPSVTAGGNANPFTVTTGGAAALAECYQPTIGSGSQNCYVVPHYQPTWPPTYYTSTSQPVMHPLACPICEGRQTVEAGFYRDVAEDKGPQTCRACKGNGLVYSP